MNFYHEGIILELVCYYQFSVARKSDSIFVSFVRVEKKDKSIPGLFKIRKRIPLQLLWEFFSFRRKGVARLQPFGQRTVRIFFPLSAVVVSCWLDKKGAVITCNLVFHLLS